ncbi:MAG: ABC transporter ATP-binding protein [Firmicutes bacterium]|nr:ABC transporter ATP-binding protein [Bacillota bacterium]
MMSLLEVKNLKKIYHDKSGEVLALDNVNFELEKEEFIAIVGPSGCGKSTILSILSNLENKSDGDIKFNVKNPKIGYMLQNDALFDNRTILQNSLLGLEVTNTLTNESKEKVISLLKTYGLEDFINKYPKSLSGGMRQRVALIRTLALDPDILLLDEPFSALDYQTRLAVSDDVYKIIKNEKKSAIIVTHDLSEAISIADKVLVLSKRPAKVKNIYQIDLIGKTTPIENRKLDGFGKYYDLIWKDLDIHV